MIEELSGIDLASDFFDVCGNLVQGWGDSPYTFIICSLVYIVYIVIMLLLRLLLRLLIVCYLLVASFVTVLVLIVVNDSNYAVLRG